VRRTLARLRRDVEQGTVASVDFDALTSHAVLQYNPPQTVPWLRTNEVALPVTLPAPPAAAAEAATEDAELVEEAEDDDSAPSDMDE